MPGINLFTAQKAGTVALTAGAATTNVAIGNGTSSHAMRVKNLDTTNIVYIEIGTSSSVTAVVPASAGAKGAVPIGPGETAGFSIPDNAWVAVIAPTGTPTVCFSPGNGA